MKRIMKRILTMLLTAAFLVSLTTTAFAAQKTTVHNYVSTIAASSTTVGGSSEVTITATTEKYASSKPDVEWSVSNKDNNPATIKPGETIFDGTNYVSTAVFSAAIESTYTINYQITTTAGNSEHIGAGSIDITVSPGIVLQNGMTQPVFDATKSIYETVFVETPCDTDNDGKRDLVEVWIRRPQETNKGMKVPVIYEASPYRNTTVDSPNHPVDVEQQINTDTSAMTYDDVRYEGMTAADWDPNAPGIPSARVSNGTTTQGTTKAVFSTNWYTYFISRGYAVVYSACLGNYNSEGFANSGGEEETLVCKTVIEWLNGKAKAYTNKTDNIEATADWCSGSVGMTGVSYNATLPIATACTGVDGLKTVVPVEGISSWYDYYRGDGAVVAPGTYQGEDLDVLAIYCNSRSKNSANYPPEIKAAFDDSMAQMYADEDRVTGDYSAYWDERNYLKNADKIKCSVYLMHGLNDWNVKTKNFDQFWAALERYNISRKLILHQGPHTSVYNHDGLNFMTNINKWFDHWLYNIDNDWDSIPNVTIQSNKDLSWQYFDTWPISTSSYEKIYFAPGAPDKTGFLSYSAPTATTQTFKDIYSDALPRPVSSTNMTNWRDYIVAASDPSAALPDRTLFMSETLPQDVRLCGTVKITANVSMDKGKGSLSAMVVDYGTDSRPSTRTTTVVTKGIDYGGGGGYANIVKFTMGSPTPYKVVTRDSTDVQNPNPSGMIYRDCPDTSYIPPYYYQTVAITPGKNYSYTFELESMDYTFKTGHKIGIIIYSTDPEYTIRPTDVTTFTLNLGEGSYIQLPVDVAPLALGGISVTAPPAKTVYNVGDSLDISGMVITGTYNDGNQQVIPVTAADVSGFDSSEPADSQKLTVMYEGKTATFNVTINAASAD